MIVGTGLVDKFKGFYHYSEDEEPELADKYACRSILDALVLKPVVSLRHPIIGKVRPENCSIVPKMPGACLKGPKPLVVAMDKY